MSGKAFIPDGYTEDCCIKALPNLHEEVHFKFRPVLPEAVRALMHNYFEKTAKQQGEIVEQTLLRQVIEWDLCDHEGEPVKLTVDNLRRIKKPLKDRLFNIVTCFEAGDSGLETIADTDNSSDLDFDDLLSGESDGIITSKIEGESKN